MQDDTMQEMTDEGFLESIKSPRSKPESHPSADTIERVRATCALIERGIETKDVQGIADGVTRLLGLASECSRACNRARSIDRWIRVNDACWFRDEHLYGCKPARFISHARRALRLAATALKHCPKETMQ